MSSDAKTLPPPKLAEPSQMKNKEGFAIKILKGAIVTVVGTVVGDRLTRAFNPSDESANSNAALGLGMFMIICGYAVLEKKPPFVSKLMMIVGTALTTAALFAPVVGLLQPPVAIAFTVIAASIFAATAVMLCQA